MPDRAGGVWHGDSVAARTIRALLAVPARLYGGVVAVRNALYDAGFLPAIDAGVPVVSVGNVTVGGAGKTPFAAWLARVLADKGASPAVVLRGYGGDEPMVHRALNPDIPVIVSADRVAGVRTAAAQGADVVVLDDAFQHRRVKREEDVALVSADEWRVANRLLPAGNLREPFSSLRRATLIVVTRKAADDADVRSLLARVRSVAPEVPTATVALRPRHLIALAGGEVQALDRLRGARVLAVAAVANSDAFFRQLQYAGAVVTRRPYDDHHRFSRHEVSELAERAAGYDLFVCTLKDAVKLAPLWPVGALRAWYVSQGVAVEDGVAEIDALVARLLASRHQRTARLPA